MKYCHIIVQPRIYRVRTIEAVGEGHEDRGLRSGHKDFEGWLARLVLEKQSKSYVVTVERNDTHR
jgi:hypothetical protein